MAWITDFNETHARDIIADQYPNPTALESSVIEWILDCAADYDESTAWDAIGGLIADLMYGGCASGMVSHLIYYSDTDLFYADHAREIDEIALCAAGESGCRIGELFRDGIWDESDPLARGSMNRCALCWLAWEQTAYNIASALGIEV